MGTVRDRAAEICAQAGEKIAADCKVMHADHSAKGLLRSGNTLLTRGLRAYIDRRTKEQKSAENKH